MDTYDSARLALWDDELEAIYARLSGRGSFSYDASADPLYAGYADRARVGGSLAMRDTMGRAAALTGGYGSSYAQAVGQREYDDYLRSLGEAMPQFYTMALRRWEDEGEALRDRYELLARRAADEREALGSEADRAAAAEKDAWQRRQAEYKALVSLIQSSGYRPEDAELDAAGLSRAAADALYEAWQRTLKPTRTYIYSSSSGKEEEKTETPAPAAQPRAGGGGRISRMVK